MQRKNYSTDLTDNEWKIIEPLIPRAKTGGSHRRTNVREVLNAIFYLLRSGCAWRLLPHDFPPWQTVYTYFRDWKECGILVKIHDSLYKELRIESGRNEEATAGIIDSQSVKTTEKGGLKAMMQARRLKDGSVIY